MGPHLNSEKIHDLFFASLLSTGGSQEIHIQAQRGSDQVTIRIIIVKYIQFLHPVFAISERKISKST